MNDQNQQSLLPAALRRQFACLRQRDTPPPVYLDSASSALKPDVVIDAIAHHYRAYPANIHRGLYPMSEAATRAYEAARAKVQRFINARHTDEIIFTGGATDAINMAAHGLEPLWQAGDEIVLTGLEHHANIVPWQMLRDRRGLRLRVVPPTPDGDIDLRQLAAALNERTRLVAFTALSNAIGTLLPVAEMVAMAHAAGALTLVDAAQSVTCCPTDVQSWDCDLLAFSGHKLFGPNGIGVLYGRRELLQRMAPFRGGGDMILAVTFEKTRYAAAPLKFEAGTMPVPQAVGLGAAIDWVQSIGLAQITQHEQTLIAAALPRLQAIAGLRIIGQPTRRRTIISFSLDNIHPHDAGTILGARNIAIRAGHHCAQPLMAHFNVPATIRASFSLYNTLDDVTALIDGIRYVQEVML